MDLKKYCLNKILQVYHKENEKGLKRNFNAFEVGGDSFASISGGLYYEYWVTGKQSINLRFYISDKGTKTYDDATLWVYKLIEYSKGSYSNGVISVRPPNNENYDEPVFEILKLLKTKVSSLKKFNRFERFDIHGTQVIVPDGHKLTFKQLNETIIKNPWSVRFEHNQNFNRQLAQSLDKDGLSKVLNNFDEYFALWKEIIGFKNLLEGKEKNINLGFFGKASINPIIDLTEEQFLSLVLGNMDREKPLTEPLKKEAIEKVSSLLKKDPNSYLLQFILRYQKIPNQKHGVVSYFSEYISDDLKQFLIEKIINSIEEQENVWRPSHFFFEALNREPLTEEQSLKIAEWAVKKGKNHYGMLFIEKHIDDPHIKNLLKKKIAEQISNLELLYSKNKEGLYFYRMTGTFEPAKTRPDLLPARCLHDYIEKISDLNRSFQHFGIKEALAPLTDTDTQVYKPLEGKPDLIHFEFMSRLEEHGITVTIPSTLSEFDLRMIYERSIFYRISFNLITSKNISEEVRLKLTEGLDKVFNPKKVILERIETAKTLLKSL